MEKNPAHIDYYETEIYTRLAQTTQITFISGPCGCGKSTIIPRIIANLIMRRFHKENSDQEFEIYLPSEHRKVVVTESCSSLSKLAASHFKKEYPRARYIEPSNFQKPFLPEGAYPTDPQFMYTSNQAFIRIHSLYKNPTMYDVVIIDHPQLLDLATQTVLALMRRELLKRSDLKLILLVTGHDTQFIEQVANYMGDIESSHISIALAAWLILPPIIETRKIGKPTTSNTIGDILINYHTVLSQKQKADPLYSGDFVVYVESQSQAEQLRIMLTMANPTIREKGGIRPMKPIQLAHYYTKFILQKYLFQPPKQEAR